jgi:hypothetical protein
MQFTILAHIIHLLFPFLIGAHVYVNAIWLLPTRVYNCEYIFCACVLFVWLWTKGKELDKMDLDLRTLPKLMEFEEQLGLMPLECYKCQRATRPHAFRMLKAWRWTLKGPYSKLPLVHSLIVNRTFWCVCFFVLGIPTWAKLRNHYHELLREREIQDIEEPSKSSFDCWLLEFMLMWLLIPKDGSYLDHQYDLKRGTPCVVLILHPFSFCFT